MKVPHSEIIARHSDSESCVAYREVRREALTGAYIGQPLSRESDIIQGADAVSVAEGHTVSGAIARPGPALRGLRTGHVHTLFVWEPGDLLLDRRRYPCRAVRIGKVRSRSR